MDRYTAQMRAPVCAQPAPAVGMVTRGRTCRQLPGSPAYGCPAIGKLAAAKQAARPQRLLAERPAASPIQAASAPSSLVSERKRIRDQAEVTYLAGRAHKITQHFESALGVDDFIQRLEIALYAFGFNGDNSIAMVNLCRDEITATLKHKIDQLFGWSFNTNGLGGVLTCGSVGMGAGLSHAPFTAPSNKERYVFFSFPHIAISSSGKVGDISRPGRPGGSCACGALIKALGDIKSEGLTCNCKIPGVHDALNPEYSILKQRLARRLRYEGQTEESISNLTLVDMTKVAERTITDDLEYLISHAVDPKKADYAVVTGVQIHNYGERFDDDSPNLEWVAPTSVYVVINGEKTHVDLTAIPALTPRQVAILARQSGGAADIQQSGATTVCNSDGASVLREIDPPYLYNTREMTRQQSARMATYAQLMEEEGLEDASACTWPSWQTFLRADFPSRNEGDNSAVLVDSTFSHDGELDEIYQRLQGQYVSRPASGSNGSSSA